MKKAIKIGLMALIGYLPFSCESPPTAPEQKKEDHSDILSVDTTQTDIMILNNNASDAISPFLRSDGTSEGWVELRREEKISKILDIIKIDSTDHETRKIEGATCVTYSNNLVETFRNKYTLPLFNLYIRYNSGSLGHAQNIILVGKDHKNIRDWLIIEPQKPQPYYPLKDSLEVKLSEKNDLMGGSKPLLQPLADIFSKTPMNIIVTDGSAALYEFKVDSNFIYVKKDEKIISNGMPYLMHGSCVSSPLKYENE